MRTFEVGEQVYSKIPAVKRDNFTLLLLISLGLQSPVLEKRERNLAKKFPKVTTKIGKPINTCKKYSLWGFGGLGLYRPIL